MAPLARRTWATLKTEHIARAGRATDTNYAARAEFFIAAAYLDLAATYHHYELDKTATGNLAAAAVSHALPADVYIVLGVEVDGKTLTQEDFAPILKRRAGSVAGNPTHWARFGDAVHFDRAISGTPPFIIYYYSLPAPPDFSTGSPATDWLWDEHILEYSVVLAATSLWRPEIAQAAEARLRAFTGAVPQPQLGRAALFSMPADDQTRDVPHGGMQG